MTLGSISNSVIIIYNSETLGPASACMIWDVCLTVLSEAKSLTAFKSSYIKWYRQ